MSHTADQTRAPTAEDFRRALRPLVAQVSVLTLSADQTLGITLTSANALSMQPPMLIACINRAASLHPHLRVGALIGWQSLGAQHQSVAEMFAGQSDIPRENRFDGADWRQQTYDGQTVQVLHGATLACAAVIETLSDHATHTVLTARILSLDTNPQAGALGYRDGAYLPLP